MRVMSLCAAAALLAVAGAAHAQQADAKRGEKTFQACAACRPSFNSFSV